MATPVKDTPVLFGEDARRFRERMLNPPPASQEEIDRAHRVYERTRVFNSLEEYERFRAGQAGR